MSAADRYALLQDYYIYMSKNTSSSIICFLFVCFSKASFFAFSIRCFFLRPFIIALGGKYPAGVIDLAAANRINQASVITVTKQSVDSGKSFLTSLVAENKDGDVSEIAGKPVWKNFGFLGEG